MTDRAGHFERVAATYDGARPPYPAEVYDALDLRPGTRVLELGAGTGLATEELVRRGAVVTAVEPGPELARRLAARLPTVEVLCHPAESAPLQVAAHDLVVVATALHWMRLDTLLPRLHATLVPGGRLAVWRTVFGPPHDDPTPFRQAVAQVKGPPRTRVAALDHDERRAELEAGGHFETDEPLVVATSHDLSAEQVRALFTTFSDWSPAEVERVHAAALGLVGPGGTVHERWVTVLHRATRT